MIIRELQPRDLAAAIEIWNRVVEDGMAFPQLEALDRDSGAEFFAAQSFTGVAEDGGEVIGLYILHPNNVGRCGHICNASYAVSADRRGHGAGEALVRHSLETAAGLGFKIMQFNAVVASNKRALALYERLGFVRLGVIPGGFKNKNGCYEDIIPQYYVLGKDETNEA